MTFTTSVAKGLAATLPLLLLDIGTGWAAERLSTAGSLLCTTGPAQDGADHKTVSCNFNGIAGGDSGFEGRMVLKGGAGATLGKRVLMWSVLAPTTEVEAAAIVGMYRGTGAGRLVGGKEGKIVLAPVRTPTTRGSAIAALELRLDPVKA